jgi:hypothetical protein
MEITRSDADNEAMATPQSLRTRTVTSETLVCAADGGTPVAAAGATRGIR